VNRAKAQWTYSNNNLHRIEPLLAKQFATVDQVDRARTLEVSEAEALKQATSQLQLSQAGLKLALAQYDHSKAVLQQSDAQHEQSVHAVTTLEPLINQRGTRASAVKTARYNLDNCRVYAPFDARVTNLTISEGAYAHVGSKCSRSLTRAPGGRLVISVKASFNTSSQGCGLTFMCFLNPTPTFPESWIASASGLLLIPTSLAVWSPASLMCSGPSFGCAWHRDSRSVSASSLPLRTHFELASQPL
jgi:multidrug efflux pump subunit AcrA (membrane-fusion protein)